MLSRLALLVIALVTVNAEFQQCLYVEKIPEGKFCKLCGGSCEQAVSILNQNLAFKTHVGARHVTPAENREMSKRCRDQDEQPNKRWQLCTVKAKLVESPETTPKCEDYNGWPAAAWPAVNPKKCRSCGTCSNHNKHDVKLTNGEMIHFKKSTVLKDECTVKGKWYTWELCDMSLVSELTAIPPGTLRQQTHVDRKKSNAMKSMNDLYDYEEDEDENALEDELDEALNEMFIAGYKQGLAATRKRQGYRYQH